MIIYLGADHRGFKIKEDIKAYLKELGYEIVDVGAPSYVEDDDYPTYAKQVAEKVGRSAGRDRGILICGSGAGVNVVANKYRDVLATLAISPDQVYAARHDDNINVLAIAADFTDPAQIVNIVKVFLATPFSNEERHKRRLQEISEIERSVKNF